MTDKNISGFELMIETTILPELVRYRKALNRFRRDVQALQKACTAAAIEAPPERNMAAAMLIEYAESLGFIDSEIGKTEARFIAYPLLNGATPR